MDSDLETGFFWILDSGSSGGRVGLYKDTGGFFKEISGTELSMDGSGLQKDIRKSLSGGFWILVFLSEIGFGFSVGFGLLAASNFHNYTIES